MSRKLVAGQALIYENANGVVYARYRDPPLNKTPRWIIGGGIAAVQKAQGELLDYMEWQHLCTLSVTNVTLKKQLDKLITTYYIIKNDKENSS